MSTPSANTNFDSRPTSTTSSSSVPLPSLADNNEYPLLSAAAAAGGTGNFIASPPLEPPLIIISITAAHPSANAGCCRDSLAIRRGFGRQSDGTAVGLGCPQSESKQQKQRAKCQQHHRRIIVVEDEKDEAAAAKEVPKPRRRRSCCRVLWIVLSVLLLVVGVLAVIGLLAHLYNSLLDEQHQLRRHQRQLEWHLESRLQQDRDYVLLEQAAGNQDRLSLLEDQQRAFLLELDMLKRKQLPTASPCSNDAKSSIPAGSDNSNAKAMEKWTTLDAEKFPPSFINYFEDESKITPQKPETASDFVVYVNGRPVSGRKFLDNQRDFMGLQGRNE